MYDIIELNEKLVSELKEIAKGLNISKYEKLKKQDLISSVEILKRALKDYRN